MKSWTKKGVASLLALGLAFGTTQGVASARIATPPQWPVGQHPRHIYDYDGDNYVMNSTVYWYLDRVLQVYSASLFGAPLNTGVSIEYAIKACRLIDQTGNFPGAAENLAQELHWQYKNDPQQWQLARYYQYWLLLGAVYYVCPDQWPLVPENMKG